MKETLQQFLKKGKRVFALFLLLFIYKTSFSQQVNIRGVVRDVTGPLPGVTVKVVGSSVGAITDAMGVFRVRANNNSGLSFTFIGYKEETISLAEKTASAGGEIVLNVLLKSEENSLEEVVVVGFGTQKKVNLTGAVGTVNAKALADRPVQNATQALQGLVTGLNISQNNGSLESTASINIRGTGTIGNSSSAPLVLVDGMEG